MHRNATAASCALFAALLLVPRLEAAQSSYSYAYIQHVEGEASLQRAAEPEPESGEVNVPVLPGDRLWTHPGARAEVVLADGSILRLAEGTKLDFMELHDAANVVRLWTGSVIAKPAAAPGLRIDAAAGSVHAVEAGLYRVDVREDALLLSVYWGAADLVSSLGSTFVTAGQRAAVSLDAPPDTAEAFNTASLDDFDHWSELRDGGFGRPPEVLVRSLPHAVQSYAPALESYGAWTEDQEYGYVWYPSVDVGWAPYRHGRWSYTPFGYTWVSHEPWGWAPYHYGRWGHGARGWYWIPGATWGPAWVSFAFGSSWIGWTPLGFYDRPVYVFNHVVYKDFHGRYAKHRGFYGHDGGWNFCRRDRFGWGGRGARMSVDQVRADRGPTQVLPSAAVLGRDLSPRTVSSAATAVRSRGYTRGDARAYRATAGARDSRASVAAPAVRTTGPRVAERTNVPSMRRADPSGTARPRGGVATSAPARATRSRAGVAEPRVGYRAIAPTRSRATEAPAVERRGLSRTAPRGATRIAPSETRARRAFERSEAAGARQRSVSPVSPTVESRSGSVTTMRSTPRTAAPRAGARDASRSRPSAVRAPARTPSRPSAVAPRSRTSRPTRSTPGVVGPSTAGPRMAPANRGSSGRQGATRTARPRGSNRSNDGARR